TDRISIRPSTRFPLLATTTKPSSCQPLGAGIPAAMSRTKLDLDSISPLPFSQPRRISQSPDIFSQASRQPFQPQISSRKAVRHALGPGGTALVGSIGIMSSPLADKYSA